MHTAGNTAILGGGDPSHRGFPLCSILTYAKQPKALVNSGAYQAVTMRAESQGAWEKAADGNVTARERFGAGPSAALVLSRVSCSRDK
jgi:hypothetical protein